MYFYVCIYLYLSTYLHITYYALYTHTHCIHLMYILSKTASFLNNADVVEVYDKTISGFYQLVNGKVRKWLSLVY